MGASPMRFTLKYRKHGRGAHATLVKHALARSIVVAACNVKSANQYLPVARVHLRLPRFELAFQVANDFRMMNREVLALANVVFEIEELRVAHIEHELPLAVTHGLLSAAGVIDAPEERSIDARLFAREQWQEID